MLPILKNMVLCCALMAALPFLTSCGSSGSASAPLIDLPAPIAGRISEEITVSAPDADGNVTISGGKGVVPAGSIVVILLDDTASAAGTTVFIDECMEKGVAYGDDTACVVAGSQGGFDISLPAEVGDSLLVVVYNPEASTQTSFALKGAVPAENVKTTVPVETDDDIRKEVIVTTILLAKEAEKAAKEAEKVAKEAEKKTDEESDVPETEAKEEAEGGSLTVAEAARIAIAEGAASAKASAHEAEEAAKVALAGADEGSATDINEKILDAKETAKTAKEEAKEAAKAAKEALQALDEVKGKKK